MKKLLYRLVNRKLRRTVASEGYGLTLLLVFLASSFLIASSMQMLLGGTTGAQMTTYQDNAVAKQVAMAGMAATKTLIRTDINAGTAVTTSTRYPASGTNTITIPTNPNNLAGATTAVGTYYATITAARSSSYLVQITATAGGSTVTLSQLLFYRNTTTTKNMRFIGRNAGEYSAFNALSAGDVDGDGNLDLLISANNADGGGVDSGEAYLIFGRSAANWSALSDVNGDFNLDNLSKANNTVRFIGRNADDRTGWSVAPAGDVNGDGYADILVGAKRADGGGAESGEAYLIFGRSTANWSALSDVNGDFNLDNLSKANNTVRFIGRNAGDWTGYKAVSAGDVDQDGYADILIGANCADGGGANSGEVYLIFGRSTANWSALSDVNGDFNLDNMSKANNTVRFIGRNAGDYIGESVASAGDVDQDGYPDLLIGADYADGGGADSGEAYLIFGRSTANWSALSDVNGDFNLDNLSKANNTVRFIGRNAGDNAGISVSSAGDVDHDGYPDLLIGADYADGGGADSGEAYLIFGRSTANWSALSDVNGDFNLDNLSKANNTVRFIGRNASDSTGYKAVSAGDVNSDGYADILIGATWADGGGADSGEAYLIFGRSTANWSALSDVNGDFNLDNLSKANNTVRFIGRNAGDQTGDEVAAAGDLNNDGYPDLLIGADYADTGGANSGEAYLIFGRSPGNWSALSDVNGDFNLDNLANY